MRTSPLELSLLSLHDALPISFLPGLDATATATLVARSAGNPLYLEELLRAVVEGAVVDRRRTWTTAPSTTARRRDRKSTRLNSSHTVISYAVFCLKKKKTKPE